jgi:hypothetical protein
MGDMMRVEVTQVVKCADQNHIMSLFSPLSFSPLYRTRAPAVSHVKIVANMAIRVGNIKNDVDVKHARDNWVAPEEFISIFH